MRLRFVEWLAPRIIAFIYFFLSRTIRWKYVGERFRISQSQRSILCFWHARMLMMPYAHRGWQGYMLISEHRDGGFIAHTMHLLGIRTIRGSSTRGGGRAMLEMIRRVKHEHCSLGITPDGPKGPREKVQKGTVQLAAKTGLPLLPVCYATKRHWRAGSWDRFYLPLPFTQGVFVFGDYVFVERGEDIESAVLRAQAAMDETQRRADTFFEMNTRDRQSIHK